MRILFSTCSAAHYMAPPRLSDEQINCGPYFEDVEIGGRVISLRTPLGEYDLAEVAARLPADQRPDAVVCLVDASWFNTPQNLAAFRCPKIALVADTHHMAKPVGGMIKYLKAEGFDRHVFLYTRHHLELFRAAGLKNLHWFPGLTFPHGDAKVRAVRQAVRESRIALVGQSGSLHQRRLRLAGALAARKLPVVLKAVSQHEGMDFYGSSLLGLNVTANGDLNLRAFEMMAAGTAMLMDRLSPESGLPQLWQDGRELVTFGSADELVERAQHLLAHPTEARAIGEAGARWFDRTFNAARRRAAFLDLVANGRELPEFVVHAPTTSQILLPDLTGMIAVYENIQKLHSTQESVQVRLDETAPADFEWLCSTLPRIQVARTGGRAAHAAARPDLVVVGRAQATAPATLAAPRVWCWDATPEDRARLRSHFESAGLAVDRADQAFYCRAEPEAAGANGKVSTARNLLQMGDREGAFEKARKTLAENPRCVESYLVMAELAHDADKPELFAKMLAKVRSLAPADPRAALLEMSAVHDTGKSRLSSVSLAVAWKFYDKRDWAAAATHAARATTGNPGLADAHFVHGLACLRRAEHTQDVEAWRQTGRGLKSLRTAVALAPQREDFRTELALAARRAGLFSEAVSVYEGLLALEPENLVGWFGLGEAHLKQDRPDDAANAFACGLERAPENRGLTFWLGHARKRQGRLDEALGLHRRSLGGGAVQPYVLRSGRRRVVFIVQHGPSWTCTASVYEAFAADPGWDAVIVALPYIHPFYNSAQNDTNAIFDFLEEKGVPHVRWDKFSLEPGFADVVFLQNSYDVTRPAGWHVTDLIRLCPRLAYVPYALEIGGGAENINLLTNLPLHHLAWAIFARSAQHKASFAASCLTGGEHVVVTGHPKMDALRDLSGVNTDELQRFAAGRKLVAWNPQFDIRLNGTAFGGGFSTFLRWWKFLPEEFTRRPDLALVIRPHPLFFGVLEDRGILSQSEVADYIGECNASGRVFIDRSPSYLPLFAAASAMMTDASSFVLEFSAIGKPLLYLHNPHGPGLNGDGAFVRDHCSTAQTEAEIATFLDAVAQGQDPNAEIRRAAFWHRYMHQPPEGVGAAVKRAVVERLESEIELEPRLEMACA